MNILLPLLSIQPIPELKMSLDRIVMDIGPVSATKAYRLPRLIRLDLGLSTHIDERVCPFQLASAQPLSTMLQHLDLSGALVSQLETRDP